MALASALSLALRHAPWVSNASVLPTEWWHSAWCPCLYPGSFDQGFLGSDAHSASRVHFVHDLRRHCRQNNGSVQEQGGGRGSRLGSERRTPHSVFFTCLGAI